jgi:hypothetical protein
MKVAISQATVLRAVHNRLHLHAHKVQIMEALNPASCSSPKTFCQRLNMMRIASGNGYSAKRFVITAGVWCE